MSLSVAWVSAIVEASICFHVVHIEALAEADDVVEADGSGLWRLIDVRNMRVLNRWPYLRTASTPFAPPRLTPPT